MNSREVPTSTVEMESQSLEQFGEHTLATAQAVYEKEVASLKDKALLLTVGALAGYSVQIPVTALSIVTRIFGPEIDRAIGMPAAEVATPLLHITGLILLGGASVVNLTAANARAKLRYIKDKFSILDKNQ